MPSNESSPQLTAEGHHQDAESETEGSSANNGRATLGASQLPPFKPIGDRITGPDDLCALWGGRLRPGQLKETSYPGQCWQLPRGPVEYDSPLSAQWGGVSFYRPDVGPAALIGDGGPGLFDVGGPLMFTQDIDALISAADHGRSVAYLIDRHRTGFFVEGMTVKDRKIIIPRDTRLGDKARLHGWGAQVTEIHTTAKDYARNGEPSPPVPVSRYARSFANLSGTGWQAPQQPELLRRSDGALLLYRGKTHSLFGSGGVAGKTWLAIGASVQVATDGGRVLYLDAEEPDAKLLIDRLGALGTPAEIRQRIRYFNLRNQLPDIDDLCIDGPFDLVVIDSINRYMALMGMDINNPTDVMTWHRVVADRCIERMPRVVVLIIDHLGKDGRPNEPTQSRSKVDVITGAMFKLERIGKGPSVLWLAVKDRPGHLERTYGRGAVLGSFTDPTITGAFVLDPPGTPRKAVPRKGYKRSPPASGSAADRVLGLVTGNPGIKVAELETKAGMRKAQVTDARRELVASGLLSEQSAGIGKPITLWPIKID
jgi:hypothetical protein